MEEILLGTIRTIGKEKRNRVRLRIEEENQEQTIKITEEDEKR